LAKVLSVFFSDGGCQDYALGHEFTNKQFRFGILVEATKGRIVSLAHSDRFLGEEGVLATKLKDLVHGDKLPIRIRSELPKTLLLKGKRFY
jgi:hypothetical protein